MNGEIEYRHWQPGDDDDILPLVLSTGWVDENYYRHKFDIYPQLEPEGIRLAITEGRVVGHAVGMPRPFFAEGRVQLFGRVEWMIVAPEMRRRGIGQLLMEQLFYYFNHIGCRGTNLSTYINTPGYMMYQKSGFREITAGSHTLVPPAGGTSDIEIAPAESSQKEMMLKLREQWAKQTFPVWWGIDDICPLSLYQVFLRGKQIVGYARWQEPSEKLPYGRIRDPIAPSESPLTVVEAVRTVISTPIQWESSRGSRYEQPLQSLDCTFEYIDWVEMLRPNGFEINLQQMDRYFWG